VKNNRPALKEAREWLDHEFGKGTHDNDRAESLATMLEARDVGTVRVCVGCWEADGEAVDTNCGQSWCPLKK
jgi:hypothetical protein